MRATRVADTQLIWRFAALANVELICCFGRRMNRPTGGPTRKSSKGKWTPEEVRICLLQWVSNMLDTSMNFHWGSLMHPRNIRGLFAATYLKAWATARIDAKDMFNMVCRHTTNRCKLPGCERSWLLARTNGVASSQPSASCACGLERHSEATSPVGCVY